MYRENVFRNRNSVRVNRVRAHNIVRNSKTINPSGSPVCDCPFYSWRLIVREKVDWLSAAAAMIIREEDVMRRERISNETVYATIRCVDNNGEHKRWKRIKKKNILTYWLKIPRIIHTRRTCTTISDSENIFVIPGNYFESRQVNYDIICFRRLRSRCIVRVNTIIVSEWFSSQFFFLVLLKYAVK